jgi:hypothetical protein
MSIISTDIGNGYTKGYDGVQTILMPSVVGPAVEISYRTDLAEGRDGRDLRIDQGGRSWFVGDLAVRQSPGAITLTARERDGELLRLLLLGALSRLQVPYGAGVQVVSGLPVAWYRPGDRKALAGALLGVHECVINGTPRMWNVVKCEIIPQVLGTLCREVLSPLGTPRATNVSSQTIGLVDIGTLTTNLAVIAPGFEYVEPLAASVEAGMGAVYALVARHVASTYDLELSPQAAETATLQRTMRVRGVYRELHQAVDGALAAVAGRILATMQALWGNAAGIDGIMVTGGGAHQLGERIAAVYSHAKVVEDPQAANAIGMYRYGRFRWPDVV